METLTKKLCEILVVVVDVSTDDYYATSYLERIFMSHAVREYGNVIMVFSNKVKFIKCTSANGNTEFLYEALANIKEEYANYLRTTIFLGIKPEKIEDFIIDKFERILHPYELWMGDGNSHFNAVVKYLSIKKHEAV